MAPTIEWGYLIYLTVFRLCQYFGADEECQFCDINENFRQQRRAGRPYNQIKELSDVLAALREQVEVPLVSGEDFPVIAPEIDRPSPAYMRQFCFVPIANGAGELTVAISDPLDFETLATLRQVTGLKVTSMHS